MPPSQKKACKIRDPGPLSQKPRDQSKIVSADADLVGLLKVLQAMQRDKTNFAPIEGPCEAALHHLGSSLDASRAAAKSSLFRVL
jgi:hypothetical protein